MSTKPSRYTLNHHPNPVKPVSLFKSFIDTGRNEIIHLFNQQRGTLNLLPESSSWNADSNRQGCSVTMLLASLKAACSWSDCMLFHLSDFPVLSESRGTVLVLNCTDRLPTPACDTVSGEALEECMICWTYESPTQICGQDETGRLSPHRSTNLFSAELGWPCHLRTHPSLWKHPSEILT